LKYISRWYSQESWFKEIVVEIILCYNIADDNDSTGIESISKSINIQNDDILSWLLLKTFKFYKRERN